MQTDEESATRRVSVIGLGRMGLPIARHLASAGHAVTGFDSSPPQRERARAAGVPTAGTVAEAAEAAEVLVTVLPGAPEFSAVMTAPDGAIDRMPSGGLWLDLTSNDPRVAAAAARRSAERGIGAVGAPMAGGVSAAQSARLGFFVAGPAPARAAIAPLLAALAAPGGVRDLGDDIGAGYAAKLLVNTLWFGQVAAVTEALLLAERLGIPAHRFEETLRGSAADSAFVRDYLGRAIDGDFATTFGFGECVDELEIVHQLAREHHVPFGVTDAVVDLHRDALATYGRVDGEMLAARLLREQASG